MATKKKMLQAAAGQAGGAGGAGLDITDVFSTYLYEGNGGDQTINNGIALGDSPDDGVYYLSSPSSLTGNNSAVSSVSATVDGTITLNSSTTKFASNSYDFDGASNLRLSRALIDTSSSFCFETWVYFASTGASNDMAMLLAQYKSGEDGRLLFGAQNGSLVVRYNGSTVALTASVSASQWYHVAWSYDGTTHRLFIDGTLEDSTTTDFPIYTGVTTQIGGTDSTLLTNYDLNGYMEDIRITTGDARYTASFTPPTASHPVTTAVTAGEGGLVWIKERTNTRSHALYDTDRGATYRQDTSNTYADQVLTDGLTSFNSNGFTIGSSVSSNNSGSDIASWTFRKAPKFFTCVTWTGDGVAGRTVSHNLGSAPGVIIVKRLDVDFENWRVYHRSLGPTYNLVLNNTNAATQVTSMWNNTAPTSTEFTLGSDGGVNSNNRPYVAYLFAHNDGDGEFGPDGDQDIIKCGSYTGTGAEGNEIDLGFEPQFILLKNASATESWWIFDNMRGVVTGGADARLMPNVNNAESAFDNMTFDATGFTPSANAYVNGNGNTMIYIAIRRGPLAPPEDATEVFDIADMSSFVNTHIVNITPDAALLTFITSDYDDGTNAYPEMFDRLRGNAGLQTPNSRAENTGRNGAWDYMDRFTGVYGTGAYMWKRAPGFCDVVAYTGNSTAGRTVSHNLGVAPEMIWVKCRSNNGSWMVYHSGMDATAPEDYYMLLDENLGRIDSLGAWNDTAPTDTEFTLRGADGNDSGKTYIAYLFASLDGISKLGSFSHATGTPTDVDCGFTAGARFVLWKKTSNTDGWQVYDTTRGITSGNDPFLQLNSTAAEITNEDLIDPLSTGFTVSANKNSGDYIFYAIA